jgi:hypothetical protein
MMQLYVFGRLFEAITYRKNDRLFIIIIFILLRLSPIGMDVILIMMAEGIIINICAFRIYETWQHEKDKRALNAALRVNHE